MASVNFDTSRPLADVEMKTLEQKFHGYEIILDTDDFEEGHPFFNYFFGYDNGNCDCEKCGECDDCRGGCDCDCDCDEELLSFGYACEATEWLEKESGLPVTRTAIRGQ